MKTSVDVDICVIGAGTGGLVVAAGASQMGARALLIEKHKMGGDCLNYGCVPSKSLIAAARVAQTVRDAAPFGIDVGEPRVDFARVQDHVQEIITAIEPHDSAARFEGLGVHLAFGEARFTGPAELVAGELTVKARRFVIATGARAAVPPIPGLADVPYLTNETVWGNRTLPQHLMVIGGGPIGCELAQAHRRLGSAVTIFEVARLLPKDDAEPASILRECLRREGVAIREGIKIGSVRAVNGKIEIALQADGQEEIVSGSHLLVAAGRRPNIEGLGLEAAGVRYGRSGIEVDDRLRTSNRRIYAVGDVVGQLQFTHMAGHHAGIVLRNALFRLPAKVERRAVPWVTYTSPELAHVGLTEATAREQENGLSILRFSVAENDRANTERSIDGLIKVVATARGKILGASILAANAGDLILPWVLAIKEGLGIKAIASVIAPYPTFSEISKSVAGSFYTPKLFSERTRKLVRLLARFG